MPWSLASQQFSTTARDTYRPPNITPGYTGYLPQQGFAYGDTFGKTTVEHFQKRRNISFLSSVVKEEKDHLPPKFPTVYSNNPSLVLANRKRTRERWVIAEKYCRMADGTKEQFLQNFLKRCQQHREHYIDRTGTIGRVDEFLLPKLTATRSKEVNESQNVFKAMKKKKN